MKLSELWRSQSAPTISFEFFPAHDAKAEANLGKAIDKLAELRPDFVSTTFGAGGATRQGSLGLAESLKRARGLEVLAYVAGYGLGPDDLGTVLDGYRDVGIENVLCVRGDVPRLDSTFVPHPQSLAHASDLLAFVRERYDLCLGAAGYPEGHVEAPSREADLGYLELKVARGASFIISQYCYDNRFFLAFVERCRARGIEVPIIAGVMPIYNVKVMENLAKLCGATITEAVRSGLGALPEGDKDAVHDFGVRFAVEQCRELLAAGVRGLHFYTMDRSKSVLEIVAQLRAAGAV
jgi:methylenetetrahydrofolate reductase (NADPH)